MAEREMKQVRVYASAKDGICIHQVGHPAEDSTIVIHPSQIDLLIQWLKELKDELQK
jgi:hypothetical protein